ncbi:hypothetical protein ABZZ74_41340 [Streptomyces sp. NPDC006476]|uniref:hypothetical protein n=1 Tax=Streptomyces sp. NPDC006476 TaxID=3157175 RepID=UPI0033A52670
MGADPAERRAPGGRPRGPGGCSENRFQVFDGVVGEVRGSSGGHGLLVVLDDLHWADEPSLRLLQWAAAVADDRVLLVGLHRGQEAFAYGEAGAVLGALARGRAADSIARAQEPARGTRP